MTDASYEPMAPGYPYHPVAAAPPRRTRASFVASVCVALAVAALGSGVGWLWAELAPRLAVVKAEQGFFYADPAPEEAVAADGWFVILGVIAGIVLAILAWHLLRRYRGLAIMIGLAVGSLAGAILAWWVGYKIGMSQFDAIRDTAAIGARVNAPLGLRIADVDPHDLWRSLPTGVIAIQALVSVGVYTVLAGFSRFSDLRGDPVPEPQYYNTAGMPLILDKDVLWYAQPPTATAPAGLTDPTPGSDAAPTSDAPPAANAGLANPVVDTHPAPGSDQRDAWPTFPPGSWTPPDAPPSGRPNESRAPDHTNWPDSAI